MSPLHGNKVVSEISANGGESMSNVKLEGEEYVRAKVEAPDSCEGYEVLDAVGATVGRAKKVFVNDRDEVEYIHVKTGLFGRKPILLPVEMVSVDDERRTLSLR
jgi:hypothetical protein